MARVCRTVLVEPPMAMSRVKALSKASRGDDVAGADVLAATRFDDLARPAALRRGHRGLGIGGQDRAVAGQGHAEGLAEAVHAVGGEHAASRSRRSGRRCSRCSASCGSVILPAVDWRDAVEDADQVDGLAVGGLAGLHRPAGDEDRRDVAGAAAAISMPGTILSQLGMQIMPSKRWAWTMVSTQSAMSSRLAREYFMPVWPMAMPSQTAMVLNSKGTPPAARTASLDDFGRPRPGGRGRG